MSEPASTGTGSAVRGENADSVQAIAEIQASAGRAGCRSCAFAEAGGGLGGRLDGGVNQISVRGLARGKIGRLEGLGPISPTVGAC